VCGELAEQGLTIAAADAARQQWPDLVEASEHFQPLLVVSRKTSRHIVGSEAAMRVKSRKPPAENCSTSERVTSLFIGGTHDG